MANIALTTAAKVEIVESLEQMTLPAAETIVAGAPVRLDTSTGKFTNGNASTAAEARIYGIATKSVIAGQALTALRRGVMDGFSLSGAYDSNVFLSDTDGRIADSAGTLNIKIGRVIPGTSTTLGTAFDKLLHVDLTTAAEEAEAEAVTKTVTSELLAASVDKWVFVADRAYRVALVEEIHSVVGGGSAAVRPRKVTAAGTDAPGAAAGATVKELTTAGIDLTAAINVTQTPALSATAADLLLADGDKIGLDFSGTLTGLVGSLTITLQPV